MNILYLSVHSILEYDEVKLFTEMGHNVLSLGSYLNPNSPVDNKRPAIPNGFYNEHLISVAIQCSKDNLHDELIEWADLVLVMHRPDWICNNWQRIKHKKVAWRSIGQSTPDIESMLALPKSEGLKLIRYSPCESTIKGYLGQDALIRFYKDQDEYSCWNGSIPAIMTTAQSMKTRNKFCGFEIFNSITKHLARVVFGPDNENTGISGGILTYEDLKAAYRNHRVYFYTGTYPASYTLSFIEALMTGTPIVAIGSKLANIGIFEQDAYEVHKIITHRVNGFCSDDPEELKGNIEYLLLHKDFADTISKAGRETALGLFSKGAVRSCWEEFFRQI